MDTEPSLEETLSKAYDEMQKPAEAADPAESATPSETGRDRDEKGRFKAKASDDTQETAVEEPSGEEITDQGSVTEAAPATEPPLSPPERWSAEWKAQFTTLPREAQKLLLDRENEYAKGFDQKSQEAAELKKRFDPVESVLAPRRQQFAMQGMTEQQGLTQLFALSDFAAQRPEDFIRWFAKERGIDLSKPNPQPGATETPPGASALPPEFAHVVTKVQSIEQTLQQQQQLAVNAVIEAFRSSPGHEHFDACYNEITNLIPAIRQANPGISQTELLQKAYDQAIWANPTVRQQMLDSEKAKAEEARKAEEAKRVEAAKQAAAQAKKAAGTTLSTKASLNGGAPAPANWQEGLERTYEQLHGAA